jgi:hypothetical protein
MNNINKILHILGMVALGFLISMIIQGKLKI